MKELGIDTVSVVYRDPDSDRCGMLFHGDNVWLIGALESQKRRILDSYTEQDEPED